MADREPQPGDGPEYHADHAAWEQRNPHDQLGTEISVLSEHVANLKKGPVRLPTAAKEVIAAAIESKGGAKAYQETLLEHAETSLKGLQALQAVDLKAATDRLDSIRAKIQKLGEEMEDLELALNLEWKYRQDTEGRS